MRGRGDWGRDMNLHRHAPYELQNTNKPCIHWVFPLALCFKTKAMERLFVFFVVFFCFFLHQLIATSL